MKHNIKFKKKSFTISSSDLILSKILLLPSIFFIGIFVYGCIIWTGYVSFSKWDGILPNYDFNGFKNYFELFQTDRFLIDIRNTLSFTVLFLLSCLSIGFILALLLDYTKELSNLFQGIFLFPMAVSFIVSGVVWRWILNPVSGINNLMHIIGFESFNPKWYTDPTVIHFKAESGLGKLLSNIGLEFLTSDKIGISVAIFSLVIAACWQFSGYTMAMYLGAIKNIPSSIREAAKIDGTTELEYIIYIVIPILRPITFGAIIILGHISLKIFDLVSAMTGPGPGFATDVPAYFMFDTSFKGNHFSQGAAVSIIILILVTILIVPYLKYTEELR
ncbi:MAG: sugar ABC transporter permease [Clostridiales bacterium]